MANLTKAMLYITNILQLGMVLLLQYPCWLLNSLTNWLIISNKTKNFNC